MPTTFLKKKKRFEPGSIKMQWSNDCEATAITITPRLLHTLMSLSCSSLPAKCFQWTFSLSYSILESKNYILFITCSSLENCYKPVLFSVTTWETVWDFFRRFACTTLNKHTIQTCLSCRVLIGMPKTMHIKNGLAFSINKSFI